MLHPLGKQPDINTHLRYINRNTRKESVRTEAEKNMIQDDNILASLQSLTPEVKARLQTLLANDPSLPETQQRKQQPDGISQTLLICLYRTPVADSQTVSSLRRSNADLQAKLFSTLSEYKNAERVAKEQITSLESSLMALREELAVTMKQKQETEEQKRYALLPTFTHVCK